MRHSADSERADIVIIGAGIAGLSLAWHLRQLGVDRVVVCESGQPGFKSTGQSSGGIRRQFGTRIEIAMSVAAWSFYEALLADPGFTGTYYRFGYAFLAGPEQITTLQGAVSLQREMGVQTQWLEPPDLRERFPYCDLGGIVGGTYCADDGFINPWAIIEWLVHNCRSRGVQIRDYTPIDAIDVMQGRVRGVQTGSLHINAAIVVIAAGAWAGAVGTLAGIEIPITPSPRVKYLTHRIADLPADMPLVTDLVTGTYVRSDHGRAMVGVKPREQITSFVVDSSPALIAGMAEQAAFRFPTLRGAHAADVVTGLYEITPDGLPLAGPVPGVTGLYVVGGFNGHGIMHGPGVTQALAELIVHTAPRTLDLAVLSPERFTRATGPRERDRISFL